MTAIVCVDKNWAIGRDNALLFHISADLKHFRALTTGKTVVMGKNTLLSLPGGRPLPNRRNLVVSTTMAPREGVEVARSVGEAAALAGEDAVLMGGAQLYRALLPRCERVLVTQVDAAAEGADAFFPNLDAAPDWTAETVGEWQEENGLRLTVDTSLEENPLTVDTWLDREKGIPIFAEVCYNGQRILTISISEFQYNT